MTPQRFIQNIQRSIINSWPLFITFAALGMWAKNEARKDDVQLMARAIADEIESREWGFETDVYTEIMDDDDVLDDMVAFTDNTGTDWYKNADGDWVNLDV